MAFQISEAEVQQRLGAKEAFEAVRRAHLALAGANAVNVVRTRARVHSGILHNMSSASSELELACAKVYLSTAKGFTSHILLYDLKSGELLHLIEANELGRLRTAATSALASATLFGTSIPSLGVIGTGFQAEGVLRSYALNLPFAQALVYGRNEERRVLFAEKMTKELHLPVSAVSSTQEILQNSDVLVTVTNASEPVFGIEELGRVKHIAALGSNSLARREIPPRAITQAKCLVVDAIEAAKKESGNLLVPVEQGRIQWSQFQELGSLLNSPKPNPNELSIFFSHGLAAQDLYLAAKLIGR